MRVYITCVICVICGASLFAAPREAKLRLLLMADLAAVAEADGVEDLARLASAVKACQEEGDVVVALLGGYWPGEWEDGPSPDNMARFLAGLPVGVAVLGEAELAVVPAVLKPFMKKIGAGVVTSNIIDGNGNSFFYPYRVLRSSGVKITFMGVSPTDQGRYQNFKLRDSTSTVRGYRNVLSRLRGGVGLTVTLARLAGHKADRLSTDVPGVDLVVCADGNSINALRDNQREEGKTGKRLVLSLGGEKPTLVELELSVKRFDPRDWDVVDYEWREVNWREAKIDKEALNVLRGETVEGAKEKKTGKLEQSSSSIPKGTNHVTYEKAKLTSEQIIDRVEGYLIMLGLKIDNVFKNSNTRKVNVTMEGMFKTKEDATAMIKLVLTAPIADYLEAKYEIPMDRWKFKISYVYKHSDDWVIICDDGGFTEVGAIY